MIDCEKFTLWDRIVYCYYRILEWPYNLKCRLFKQYYKIEIKTLSKYYWLETDDKLVHGIMELVREYVEDQNHHFTLKYVRENRKEDYLKAGSSDTPHDDDTAKGLEAILLEQWDEAETIYNIYLWWKEDYPRLVQSVEDLYDEMPTHRTYFKKIDDEQIMEDARKFKIIGKKEKCVYEWLDRNTEDERSQQLLYSRLIHECEKDLENLLTDKLCSIIKLRYRMWT